MADEIVAEERAHWLADWALDHCPFNQREEGDCINCEIGNTLMGLLHSKSHIEAKVWLWKLGESDDG